MTGFTNNEGVQRQRRRQQSPQQRQRCRLYDAGKHNNRVEEENEDEESEDAEDRGGSLRKVLQLLDFTTSNNNSDGEKLLVGATCIVQGNSLPALGLQEWQSYELRSVYDQGMDAETGRVVKIPRPYLSLSQPPPRKGTGTGNGTTAEEEDDDDDEENKIPIGYQRYITLYAARYHRECGPVIVSPADITLVSVREEVRDSLLMALPIFGFWTALAISFANVYNDRYGGNFLDALFRT